MKVSTQVKENKKSFLNYKIKNKTTILLNSLRNITKFYYKNKTKVSYTWPIK